MSCRSAAVFAIGLWAAAAGAAAAQDADAPAASTLIFSNLERYLPSTAPERAFLALPSGDARVLPREHRLLDRWPLDRLPLDRLPLDRWRPRRPDRFETLCLTLVGLTVLDTITTSRALGDGTGRELNPLLAPFASNTFALATTKAGVDAAAIYFARKLWHRDPDAAVKVLIASNGVVGVAVVRNALVGAPDVKQ